jgi:hypothetical protein
MGPFGPRIDDPTGQAACVGANGPFTRDLCPLRPPSAATASWNRVRSSLTRPGRAGCRHRRRPPRTRCQRAIHLDHQRHAVLVVDAGEPRDFPRRKGRMEREEPQVGRPRREMVVELDQALGVVGTDRPQVAASADRQHHLSLKNSWIVGGQRRPGCLRRLGIEAPSLIAVLALDCGRIAPLCPMWSCAHRGRSTTAPGRDLGPNS